MLRGKFLWSSPISSTVLFVSIDKKRMLVLTCLKESKALICLRELTRMYCFSKKGREFYFKNWHVPLQIALGIFVEWIGPGDMHRWSFFAWNFSWNFLFLSTANLEMSLWRFFFSIVIAGKELPSPRSKLCLIGIHQLELQQLKHHWGFIFLNSQWGSEIGCLFLQRGEKKSHLPPWRLLVKMGVEGTPFVSAGKWHWCHECLAQLQGGRGLV